MYVMSMKEFEQKIAFLARKWWNLVANCKIRLICWNLPLNVGFWLNMTEFDQFGGIWLI